MSEEASEKTQPEKAPEPKDALVVTRHTTTLGGTQFPYTVTCGTIILKEESLKKGEKEGEFEGEKARASIFFIAYTRDEVSDASRRPLTFSFNGGPGSASVWMHLGLLGPRRVEMGDVGSLLPPPFQLADNPNSILDETDLVFIDPVSTGYSRTISGEKPKQFHDFTKDIESVGDFIHLYTSRYRRWGSPKYLIGESYGTTRAAGLSKYLQERHTMYLNGIILVSTVLNFQTLYFEPGNDLPYLLYLPSYTATAWYHRRLAQDLQSQDLRRVLDEAEAFTVEEYSLALLRGDDQPAEARLAMVRKLARYTGLSEDFVDRSNLRIEHLRFSKELLRDQKRTVGRIDSRFTGIDRDAVGEIFERDPSMSAIMGPYGSVFNHYVRTELNFESDLPYEVLKSLEETWSFSGFENRYVNVGESLRQAISVNPHLKVLVLSGYFDLATPYFGTDYTLSHLALDETLRGNISKSYYEAGHMMYMHQPSLEQMKADLSSFIRQSHPGGLTAP